MKKNLLGASLFSANLLGLALLATLALPGCRRSTADESSGGVAPTTAAATATAPTTSPAAHPAVAAPAAAAVAKVVFVGKTEACDCTRKTINATWATLQQALGAPAKVPVERLEMDTGAAAVAPYLKQKPIMALPGLYFLNAENGLVAFLQGEVTAAQVAAGLQGKTAAR